MEAQPRERPALRRATVTAVGERSAPQRRLDWIARQDGELAGAPIYRGITLRIVTRCVLNGTARRAPPVSVFFQTSIEPG